MCAHRKLLAQSTFERLHSRRTERKIIVSVEKKYTLNEYFMRFVGKFNKAVCCLNNG